MLVARIPALIQQLVDYRLETFRCPPPVARDRLRLVVGYRMQRGGLSLGGERRVPGYQFVKDNSKREEIAAMIRCLTANLLR